MPPALPGLNRGWCARPWGAPPGPGCALRAAAWDSPRPREPGDRRRRAPCPPPLIAEGPGDPCTRAPREHAGASPAPGVACAPRCGSLSQALGRQLQEACAAESRAAPGVQAFWGVGGGDRALIPGGTRIPLYMRTPGAGQGSGAPGGGRRQGQEKSYASLTPPHSGVPTRSSDRPRDLPGLTHSLDAGERGRRVSLRREPRSSGGAEAASSTLHRLLGRLVLPIRGRVGGARSAALPSALRTSRPRGLPPETEWRHQVGRGGWGQGHP